MGYEEQGHRCQVCKKGTFLHEGRCVSSCRSDLTHYGKGNYGRQCREVFECIKRKDSQGMACKCPNNGFCIHCKWEAGNEAGASKCMRCSSGRYLLREKGTCVKKCPEGYSTNGVTAAFGRECV